MAGRLRWPSGTAGRVRAAWRTCPRRASARWRVSWCQRLRARPTPPDRRAEVPAAASTRGGCGQARRLAVVARGSASGLSFLTSKFVVAGVVIVGWSGGPGAGRGAGFFGGDPEQLEQPGGGDAVGVADADHPAGKLVMLGEFVGLGAAQAQRAGGGHQVDGGAGA